MPFNYYTSGKYGTLPQQPEKNGEVTQDMHLKMSKKIAQLTKVIYALNTKNDEHEAILQSVKEQHEEEMQMVLSDTKDKILKYRSAITGDNDLKQRISILEKFLSDNEKEKEKAFKEFADFKRTAEDRETKMKTEHAQKMLGFSTEVLAMKKDFEEKLKTIDRLKRDLEIDKETALDDLRSVHQKEIEDIWSRQQNQHTDLAKEKERLENEYSNKIKSLEEQNSELRKDRDKITEEYEYKLNKAQQFYEKELEALRNSKMSESNEQVAELREEMSKMRKSFSFQEAQMKKRIEELIEKLADSEEDVNRFKSEMEALQASMKSRDGDSQSLVKKLAEVTNENANIQVRLKEVQSELSAAKERCAEQAEEMLKRSTKLGQLEATRLQNESTIKDLQNNLAKVKDKLAWLEKERNSLEQQSSSQVQEQSAQLRALEKALEDLSIEKQTQKERFERDYQLLEERSSEKQTTMEADHKKAMEQLIKDHQDTLSHHEQESQNALKALREELENKHETERDQLIKEKSDIQNELDRVRADLSNKLQTAEDEIARLQKLIKDREDGLGTATSQFNSLRTLSDKLQSDLDHTKEDLRLSKNKNTYLQTELDKLKALHDSKMKEMSKEQADKLDQLAKELERKWTDTLRNECLKLRQELTAQKDEDKRAALAELSRLKDQEIAATRGGWERKVSELLQQIKVLKEAIENSEATSGAEVDRIRREAEEKCNSLETSLLDAALEYANKIKAMEKIHADRLAKLEASKESELKSLDETLRTDHSNEMNATTIAHKSHIDQLKKDSQTKLESDLETQYKLHLEEKDKMRSELQHKHAQDIEQHIKAHQTQLNAARMELERSLEITKLKTREHEIKVEDMQSEIRHREKHIENVEHDIRELQTTVDQLTHEIDFKGKEILKVRSEANQQMRKREEALYEKHQGELNELSAEHLRETQDMLGEFNRAQEILKDKISALQIMLEEAEERYRDRESRPEDLQLIHNLQEALHEREAAMQKAIEDKRYYQREIINRETNYNKVFSTSPQVGVLNPFASKKKKGSGDAAKYTSAPSLNTTGSYHNRLNHISGSPIHDERLNPSDPLPPMTKKFVK